MGFLEDISRLKTQVNQLFINTRANKVSNANQVFTKEVTIAGVDVKAGFGWNIAIPPGVGKALVILSAEARMNATAFTKYDPAAVLLLKVDTAVTTAVTWNSFLDAEGLQIEAGDVLPGDTIIENKAIKMESTPSAIGSAPVTISVTYKIINV